MAGNSLMAQILIGNPGFLIHDLVIQNCLFVDEIVENLDLYN